MLHDTAWRLFAARLAQPASTSRFASDRLSTLNRPSSLDILGLGRKSSIAVKRMPPIRDLF